MADKKARTRLTDRQKMKIVEDSKKAGFDRSKVMKEHSLSRSGLYRILHEKEKFSPAKVLTESPMKGVKSHRRLKHDDLEKKLMQWIIETERRGLLVGLLEMEKPFQCTLCDKTFSQFHSYRRKTISVHTL